ncbi:MAG: HlyD family efflux transporter periplasmic adaptor subunit [Acidobacteria bacterium]|nr:HlyD family efflux transporter periplasmic adaptor subunit [Acidobacteriota bacterium]
MPALTDPAGSRVQAHSSQPALVTPEPPRKYSPWKWLLTLAVVAAGAWTVAQLLRNTRKTDRARGRNTPVFLNGLAPRGAAFALWRKPRQAPKPAATLAEFRTAKVVTGPFERVIRLSGQTAARDYALITAPRVRGADGSQMELLQLAKGGSWVKKEDVLVQIDPGWMRDHADDTRANVVQADLDVKKRVAEQQVESENLQQTVRVSRSQLEKSRLDNSAAEVLTDVERELLKLSVEEGEAQFKQVQLELPIRKAVHAAEIKILGFTKQRHARHLERDLANLKAYTIRSPMEGLVVLQSTPRGGGESLQLQQGDQLGPGQALMRVVNPNSMQVEASMNQAESTAIRIGQQTTIGFDAFPELTFRGRVYSIGALAVGGFRQNNFIRSVPVRLSIEGSNPKLTPDLSAFTDIVVEKIERAVQVPSGAIHHEGGKNFVYVKQGEQFVKRQVALGSANNLFAVASSGLEGGEEVRVE